MFNMKQLHTMLLLVLQQECYNLHLTHSRDDTQHTSSLAHVIFLTIIFITNTDSVQEKCQFSPWFMLCGLWKRMCYTIILCFDCDHGDFCLYVLWNVMVKCHISLLQHEFTLRASTRGQLTCFTDREGMTGIVSWGSSLICRFCSS